MNLKIRIECIEPGIFAIEQYHESDIGGRIIVVEDVPEDVEVFRVVHTVEDSQLIDVNNPPSRIRWSQIAVHDPVPKS